MDDRRPLCTWDGELYLELHQVSTSCVTLYPYLSPFVFPIDVFRARSHRKRLVKSSTDTVKWRCTLWSFVRRCFTSVGLAQLCHPLFPCRCLGHSPSPLALGAKPLLLKRYLWITHCWPLHCFQTACKKNFGAMCCCVNSMMSSLDHRLRWYVCM